MNSNYGAGSNLRWRELEGMIERAGKDEEVATALHKQTVEMTEKNGDIATATLFREILEDEEEHHDTFTGLLEEI